MPGGVPPQPGPAGIYQWGTRADIKTLATLACTWGLVLILDGADRFVSPAWATARLVPGEQATVGAVFIVAGLVTWAGILAGWNRRVVMVGMTLQGFLSLFLAVSLYASTRDGLGQHTSRVGAVTYLGVAALCLTKTSIGRSLNTFLRR